MHESLKKFFKQTTSLPEEYDTFMENSVEAFSRHFITKVYLKTRITHALQ